MTAITNSLFNRHQGRIEEIINKNIEIFMPALDPVWQDTIVTSQGVGGANEIGRDMHIIKVFLNSMAGILEEGAAQYGDLTLYGDTTTAFGSKLHTQQLNQTWPSALDGPNATPYRIQVPIRSMMSNLLVTLGELQAEATPAFIGEVLTPKLEGFARNLAHTLCNYWYISQNTKYSLCTVTSVSISSATVTFKPNNQATDRFNVGMRVDVIVAAGTGRANDTASGGANQSKTTRISLFVSKVDELTNTVELTSDVAVASWTGAATVANGDFIVYANSGSTAATPLFKGIAGINSWLKTGDSSGGTSTATNTLLGAEAISADHINVNTHPEFKSFFKAHTGGPLTEHTLRQYLRGFHRAKNKYGQYIDCLVASDGVWLAYEATKIGREILDRTGRLSSLTNEGSNQGFSFTMDGRTYTGYTSNYVETGTVYGIKKGNSNWKRYVPPDPRGATTMSNVKPGVPFRFVAGILTGTGSNRIPVFKTDSGNAGATNLITEGSQMPGMLRMQIVPDQAAGIKITGCDEDRVYADS